MSKTKLQIMLLMLSLFFNNSFGFVQDSIQRDSSNIKLITFKEGLKERYKSDDFNYTINDTGGVNLLQRILQKFFGWLSDVFGIDIDFISYQTLEYIVYGFLGLATLYLIIKFLMISPINSVFKTETKTIDGFNYIEEDIKDIDFDVLINEALKENNFRLATRYLYLKSLKLLANKHIIEWHYDKTNSDYINEIKDDSTKSIFKRISYIYDYVWYGEFPIDEDMYQKNESDFNKLNTLQNG